MCARLVALGVLVGPAAVHAQEDPLTPEDSGAQDDSVAIDVILESSFVDDVLMGQADAFLFALGQVTESAGEVVGGEAEAVVREEFAPDRLRGHVIDALRERARVEELVEASELFLDGPIGRVNGLVATYEPDESLEAFMRSLRSTPPRPERVEVLTELADAQQTAVFYLLLDETAREGAHRVASLITDGRSASYEELAPAGREEQLRRGREFAVATYLHRLEPVDDALAASAAEAYRSERGQWFVETYARALADALQLAALRVAGRLSG